MNVDEYAKREARERAWQTYERLSKLDDISALKLGAEKGPYDQVPTLRFDEAAFARG